MSKASHDSLYFQLRRAKKLDDLMHFLEDPSTPNPGTYSRCAKAEPMLAEWGFAHSPSTIWRLYRRHILSWRMGVNQSSVKYTENPEDVAEENRHMTAQRTSEFLANPNLDPHVLVDLAKIEHHKDVLRLDERRFAAALKTKVEMGLDAISDEIKANPQARAAFKALGEALNPTNSGG